jgi:hypothetical protein
MNSSDIANNIRNLASIRDRRQKSRRERLPQDLVDQPARPGSSPWPCRMTIGRLEACRDRPCHRDGGAANGSPAVHHDRLSGNMVAVA